MLRILSSVYFFSLLLLAHAQAPAFQWAKSMGGTAIEYSYGICTDASGNIYTTGYFLGTADFDPGPGTFNLVSGSDYSTFISKLDAAGNFVWAKKLGGNSDDEGQSIAVDNSGNIYAIGMFQGTGDFDPGTGTYNLTSNGSSDVFIVRLDNSGNFVWAKNFGGISSEQGASISADANGNIYTTGNFLGTCDFDPSAGIYNLSSSGAEDLFISKLDNSGNFVWAKKIGGIYSDHGQSINIDTYGNILITGYFEGTTDFDPGAGTTNLTASSQDIFVLKLDGSGNYVWAKKLGGKNSDIGYSIQSDLTGNIFTTGFFVDTADFNPDTASYNLVSGGSSDIFISKLSASGNFIWAGKMGGSSIDIGRSVFVSDSGNIFLTGYFSDTSDFDPGNGITLLQSNGGFDVFISKLDASGKLVWAKSIGGPKDDYVYGITLDDPGNIYTTGVFQGSVDFNQDAGSFNLTSAGIYDIFVHKISQGKSGIKEIDSYKNRSVYPNPSNGIFNISYLNPSGTFTIELYNTFGALIHKTIFSGTSYTFDLSHQPNGLYIVKAIDENNIVSTFKIIKQ